MDYVEAGRRFYVKIEDDDLPVLRRLGKQVALVVTTSKGDAETEWGGFWGWVAGND